MPISTSECGCHAPVEQIKLLCYTTWVTGQKCTKCGDVIVSQSVFDDALAKFVAKRKR